MAQIQEQADAKVAEMEANADKLEKVAELEATIAALQAAAEAREKEFESVMARLNYFEEEKKRNSSAAAMFKQQQEKEAQERAFNDKIKIQARKIDSLEGESENFRDEVKALKKSLKEREDKLKEAGIDF